MSKPQLHPELELSDFEKLVKFAETIENTYCPETITDELCKSIYDLAMTDLAIIVNYIKRRLVIIQKIENLKNL